MPRKRIIDENKLDLKEIFKYVIKRNTQFKLFDWTSYYISRTILYRWLPKELGWWSFATATRIFDRLAKEWYIENPDSDLGRYELINIDKFLEN